MKNAYFATLPHRRILVRLLSTRRPHRGNQVTSEVYGRKYGRISMISAWLSSTKELIAPYVFDGYTDSKRFNGWLEKYLLLELKKGQVVIMDNAAFHKSKKTKELIESVGCRLLFQPAYSPDLNPIEKQWAVLKAKFKNININSTTSTTL